MSDDARELLRHTVATLAYRSRKILTDPPSRFSSFRACDSGRSAGEILAHVCDLFDWGIALADGQHVWHDTRPRDWDDDVARFYALLAAFDRRLSAAAPLGHTAERLFQGPVADALTHMGQIAMLRRMADSPIRAENYFKADIAAGRVGLEQAAPKVEF